MRGDRGTAAKRGDCRVPCTRFALHDLSSSLNGDISFRALANYVSKFETRTLGVTTVNLAGQLATLVKVPGAFHDIAARPSQSAAKANAVLAWFARYDTGAANP